MAEILAMDDLTPVQIDHVDLIRQSGETLLLLLNDILDLSKIEAGKLDIEIIEFDLGRLLQDVFQTFAPLALAKGLDPSLEMGADGIYRGDPTRIRQILSNLLSNALKFTARGAIRITGAINPQDVTFSVADTGIGIPADRLAELFQKFTQVDSSTTRRFGGTGLGLSICRELAGIMGGTVGVESWEGVGSRFTVTLPLERVRPAPRGHASPSEAANSTSADKSAGPAAWFDVGRSA